MKYKKAHYYNYSELTDFIKYYSETYPEYMQFASIGVTDQQRDIWQISLTNFKTGLPENKPSFLIDGNMHAGEIAGTQVCLYTVHHILSAIKTNKTYQALLDKTCLYIIPRICPDAAEHYLKTDDEIRSSLEKWPVEDVINQFILHDMDGNGQILQMRKKDPGGAFKISKKNSSLMVARQHDDFMEEDGEFYSLYPEGSFKDRDKTAKDFFKENYTSYYGIDLNRQFPVHYRPEGEQMGAGPYPGYVIEARSMMEFVSSQPRIYGHLNLHTYGGMILRPPSAIPDEKISAQDISILNALKNKAAEVSGYMGLNIFKEFRYTDRDVIKGSLSDWTFEHRGIYSSVVEIWDVWKEAGIENKDPVSRFFWPKESDLNKIFHWAKKTLPLNSFYNEWKKFKHPQLGEVEIGGWQKTRVFRNPPEKLLEAECEKVFKIILSQMKMAPLVELQTKKVKKISGNTFSVTLNFKNSGYLPTNGSDQAIRVAAIKKPKVKIQLGKNQKLIQGNDYFEIDHVAGRSRFLPWHTPLGFVARPNTNELQLEWVIQGKGEVTLTADFQRGGLFSTKISVK